MLLTVAGPRSLALFSYTVDGKPVYYEDQNHDHHFNTITIKEAVSSEIAATTIDVTS